MARAKASKAVQEIKKRQAELKQMMRGASPAKRKALLKKTKALKALRGPIVSFFIP